MSGEDTVNSIITSALRKIGLPPSQQPVPASMTQRGLEILNDILDMWGGSRLFIPYQNKISLTLSTKPVTSPQTPYTIGESNIYDLNNAPIIDILECNILDPNSVGVYYPTQSMTEQQYANIPYKISTGLPSQYMLRSYPDYSEIYFQVLPYTVLTALMVVKQRLSRVTINDDLSEIPRFYLLALKYKIAINAANVWGKTLTDDFRIEAKQALDILAANCANIDYTTRRDEQMNRGNTYFFNWWI